MKKIILVASLATFALFSCSKEEVIEKPTPSPLSFEHVVQPILQANCGTGSNCHGAQNGAAGKIFENYIGAKAVDRERVIGAVKQEMGFKPMPKSPAPALSANDMQKIIDWYNSPQLND